MKRRLFLWRVRVKQFFGIPLSPAERVFVIDRLLAGIKGTLTVSIKIGED